MKMIAGAACLACSNRSRTRDAPIPTIASMNSEAEAEKKGTPASPATARARSVLPVPGRPESSTPRGILAPSLAYFSGFRRKSTTSTSSFSASSMPATSSKFTVWVSDSTRLARERPNWLSIPPAPPPLAARRARNTNRATRRMVGPKEKRIVSKSERLPGGSALTVTSRSVSSCESSSSLAKVGISVSNLVALSSLYLTSLRNSPCTVSAVEEISFTLPSRTCFEERRVVGHADALLGRREDRDDQPVQEEENEQDHDKAPPAPRDHRLLLGRLAAPVRSRADAPARALSAGLLPRGRARIRLGGGLLGHHQSC